MHFDNFLKTLPMMAMGMGGILVVTAILIVIMLLLTKLFRNKK